MVTRRWAPRLHRWIALVVGIQLLAWSVSGLFMTVVPISQVRGEHNIRKQETVDIRAAVLVPIANALERAPAGAVARVELRAVAGRPVYEIAVDGSSPVLLDARSGALVSPVTESYAIEIAVADFAGAGRVTKATLITEKPPIEFRGDLPVWQISFDDPDETNLYVSAATGRVVARRSATWRIYDFLWSLHIMDYSERDNFNNPLVIAAAAIAFVLAVSGVVMLYLRFSPSVIRRWRSSRKQISQ